MRIIIGSDHAGFELKEKCKVYLEKELGKKVEDIGVFDTVSSDYPDIGHRLAEEIAKGRYKIGILICGTGVGMCMVANRYRGVRAALCHDLYTTRYSRLHNDANVLVMGARVIGDSLAFEIIKTFLETPFEGGRHSRRVEKIDGERNIGREEFKGYRSRNI